MGSRQEIMRASIGSPLPLLAPLVVLFGVLVSLAAGTGTKTVRKGPLLLKTAAAGVQADPSKTLNSVLPKLMAGVKPIKVQPPEFKELFGGKTMRLGPETIDWNHLGKIDPSKEESARPIVAHTTRQRKQRFIPNLLAESNQAEDGETEPTEAPPVSDAQLFEGQFIPPKTKADDAAAAAVALVQLVNQKEQCAGVRELCPTPNRDPHNQEKCNLAIQICDSEYTKTEADTCLAHGARGTTDVAAPLRSIEPDPEGGVALLQEESNTPTEAETTAAAVAHRMVRGQPYSMMSKLVQQADAPLQATLNNMMAHGGATRLAEANDMQQNPIAGQTVALKLPNVGTEMGQAVYAKIMCQESKARCDSDDPMCEIALHQ